MVKKQKKRTVHKSSTQRTIQQGLQFVNTMRKIISRKFLGTKTMKQIVRTNDASLRVRTRKQKQQIKIQKPQGKKQNKSTKRVITKSETRSNKKIKSIQKNKKLVSRSKSSKASVPAPHVVTPILPITSSKPTSSIVRSGSRASNTGKVAQLSKSKSKDLQIPAFGFIDVCFCVDSTGSMSSQLAQVQEIIKSIITNIQTKVSTQGLQLRFAIVSYRDHPPQESTYVTNHLDFTDQYQAIQYVKTLNAFGGGDEPEAAHDGLLLSAQKLNWVQQQGTPVLRYIFHIADAPPHGKQFKNLQAQQGCICGLQTDDVIRQINKKSIHYRLIKVRANQKVNQMERIFKQKIGDFDSTDISHARQLNVKVSDMIIHEVLPDYA